MRIKEIGRELFIGMVRLLKVTVLVGGFTLITFMCSLSEGAWQIEVVDTLSEKGGVSTSLALDSNDNPHIVFSDRASGAKYAHHDGSHWAIIDPILGGGGTSLALNSKDEAYIVGTVYNYSDGQTEIVLSYYGDDNLDCNGKYLDPDPCFDSGYSCDIAVDSNNIFTAIYYNDPVHRDCGKGYIQLTSGCNQYIQIRDTMGGDFSIAIDSKDYRHIGGGLQWRGLVYYLVKDLSGGVSLDMTVDDSVAVGDCSIAIDSNDNPHICYRDERGSGLKYAYFDGITWQIETIVSEGGGSCSIAIDSNDKSHIVYQGHSLEEGIRYATRYKPVIGPPRTEIETVRSGWGGDFSIAIDSNDIPHFSYIDAPNRSVKYASFVGGSSTTTTTNGITTTSSTGSSSSTTTSCNPVDPCCTETLYGEHSDEVELLRYYRDNVLTQTTEGREIINIYYQWSPVIVEAMKADEEFKEEVKELIDGVLGLIEEVME